MDTSKMAARLKELRGKKTQAKVCEEMQIPQSTYAMYEAGRRVPSDEMKIKIARYYKRSVQSIFFT